MTSLRKSSISKYVKAIETITCRKVLKYFLAFDEESKRKLLNLISQDIFIKIIVHMILVLKFPLFMSKNF